jgi:ubiquinone/menaquinone biosynthesis C-methylase UbiE
MMIRQISARIERERDFWNHMVPTVDEALAEYHRGPDPNTRLMLEAVRPGPGRKILDFACGGGVTTAWLAAQGAEVTGVDLSPASITTARRVADDLRLNIDFRVADVEQLELPPRGFDALVGRYALHHLDVSAMSPALANCLRPDGVGAFVETMGINPVLKLARNKLTGRFGIPRFGTVDEHPLEWPDIEQLRQAFGSAELVNAEYRFVSMIDRQILRGRIPRALPVLRWIDSRLAGTEMFGRWSFHQVVLVKRTVGIRHLQREMVVDVPKVFPRKTDSVLRR